MMILRGRRCMEIRISLGRLTHPGAIVSLGMTNLRKMASGCRRQVLELQRNRREEPWRYPSVLRAIMIAAIPDAVPLAA
eukprot:12745255-Prorocentrum_lima.AAC.1